MTVAAKPSSRRLPGRGVAERIADASRLVPERADVETEEGPDGRLTLRRRRFGAVRGALVGLAGVPRDFTVHLDGLGSAAWRLVDGRRTVGEVRAELQRSHPQEPDLPARLGKFLGTMASHGMLRLR
jgi:hypothetical protein